MAQMASSDLHNSTILLSLILMTGAPSPLEHAWNLSKGTLQLSCLANITRLEIDLLKHLAVQLQPPPCKRSSDALRILSPKGPFLPSKADKNAGTEAESDVLRSPFMSACLPGSQKINAQPLFVPAGCQPSDWAQGTLECCKLFFFTLLPPFSSSASQAQTTAVLSSAVILE